jgi:hypothetical protein
MKLILIIILLCLPVGAQAADPWDKQDIALEVLWQCLHAVDWGQTLDIASRPERYREINPLIGEHPSRARVNAYMGLSTLTHIGITHLLPKSYRPYWQMITIGISGTLIIHNFNIGLQVRF